MKKESLTVREAGEILNISEQTIRRMMKAGKMEHFKVGSSYRIRRSVVEEIMNSREK